MTPQLQDLRHQKKIELADKIDDVVRQIVDAMPEKIDKAGLKDSAIAMGTGIDKANLLRGEPTSITGTTSESAESLFAKQYRQINQCSESEALEAASEAFAFARVKDEGDKPPA